MSKAEIIDKYWLEFLKWGKKQLYYGGPVIGEYKFNEWTEKGFWKWYVEEKL